jgi:signal peptidase II
VSAPSVAVGPRVRLLSLIAVLVLAVDIATKSLAVAQLEGRPPAELFGGLVWLTVIRNPGAAWSMATGYTWILSLIAITVVIVLIRVARRLRSTGWAIALALVLGGAVGNLIDRLFRAPGPLRGHVVDMVSIVRPDGSFFPVFNAADSAVCCGGILLVLLALTGRELDGTRTQPRRRGRADTATDIDTDTATDTDTGTGSADVSPAGTSTATVANTPAGTPAGTPADTAKASDRAETRTDADDDKASASVESGGHSSSDSTGGYSAGSSDSGSGGGSND